MEKTIGLLLYYIKPYYYYIIVSIIVLLFIIAAYWGYYKYAAPKIGDQKKFNDVANVNTRNVEANVYFFYADWCPHCVKAKPEWEAFVTENENKVINGYQITPHSIDCSGDIDGEVDDLIQKYSIDSYPTVKLIVDGQIPVDMDSRITQESLDIFVNEVLNTM